MLKIYMLAALVIEFSSVYSMGKEQVKFEYREDARHLSGEHGLYFSLLPKDVLGMVQYYRVAELLGREVEKALENKYAEALKNIAHLAQSNDYAKLFNDLHYIDGIIQKISSKFGKYPEEVAWDINTAGAKAWLEVIRPDQVSLAEAVAIEDLPTVRQLIAAGVNANAQDRYCKTALMQAAGRGFTEIAQELIGSGADVNAHDNLGYTPLMRAASYGHTEIVKKLIAAGANINAQSMSGCTVLIDAAGGGWVEMVKLFLATGADINIQDIHGNTAFMWAAGNIRPEIVSVLRAAGADINGKNIWDKTALMYAAQNGRTEIVKILIDFGANINAQDEDGRTALDYARQQNNTEIWGLLERARNT